LPDNVVNILLLLSDELRRIFPGKCFHGYKKVQSKRSIEKEAGQKDKPQEMMIMDCAKKPAINQRDSSLYLFCKLKSSFEMDFLKQ
jgi:hypothetical protein